MILYTDMYFHFSCSLPRSKRSLLYGRFLLNFWINCQPVLQSDCLILQVWTLIHTITEWEFQLFHIIINTWCIQVFLFSFCIFLSFSFPRLFSFFFFSCYFNACEIVSHHYFMVLIPIFLMMKYAHFFSYTVSCFYTYCDEVFIQILCPFWYQYIFVFIMNLLVFFIYSRY